MARLITAIRPDSFLRLIENNFVTCHYSTELTGIRRDGPRDGLDIAAISLARDSLVTNLQRSLHKGGVQGSNTRAIARRIAKKISHFNYSSGFISGYSMLNLFRRELDLSDYLSQNFLTLYEMLYPKQPIPFQPYFRVKNISPRSARFEIDTNINFKILSDSPNYNRLFPSIPEPSVDSFINLINNTTFDITSSLQLKSSMLTNEVSRAFAENRYLTQLNVLGVGSEPIFKFQEVVFPNGRRLADAIDTNAELFKEFLDLIERTDTQRFRHWLHGIKDFEHNGISEYISCINAETWLNSLPAKTFRFSSQIIAPSLLASIIPASAPFVASALGIIDTFLLDRLFSGWRPSTFINGPLKTLFHAMASH